jgi:hypothetical protein
MEDIKKLAHLIEHWMEHNEEHAKNYRNWAEKARAAGRDDLASILDEITAETQKMQGLFSRAKEAAF